MASRSVSMLEGKPQNNPNLVCPVLIMIYVYNSLTVKVRGNVTFTLSCGVLLLLLFF